MLLSAGRPKIRVALGHMTALAALLLCGECRGALLAELAALGLRAAGGTDGAGDLGDVTRLGPVDFTGLGLNLLARGVGLRGRHLFVEIRCAVFTEAGLLVPTDRLTDPVPAARALFEDR